MDKRRELSEAALVRLYSPQPLKVAPFRLIRGLERGRHFGVWFHTTKV